MKAMILAAGKGSRLLPLTKEKPKPLLTVKGRPLIDILIRQLSAAKINSLVVNVHHLGNQIKDHLGDGHQHKVEIQYSVEDELLETGGGIKNALKLLGTDPFILVNGDIYTDFDFSNLPKILPEGILAHLVVKKSSGEESGDFLIKDNEITSRGSNYTYCVIAIISPLLFAKSPSGAFSWTRDLLFAMIGKAKFSTQEHLGNWTDIGTPEQYYSVR